MAVVDEDRHIENIKTLSNSLSDEFADILINGRFRIGPAQKALNLYLKYLWCLDRIEMPPHCPFDTVVISQLPPADRRNWTEIDGIDIYKNLVEAARGIANGVPLAERELRMYNEYRQAYR